MLDLVPISLTGFNKLVEEVNRLEKEAAETRKRVSQAREMGDLKENGEFIYGRQQLGFIEGRLGELRAKINHSDKIDCTKSQIVAISANVTFMLSRRRISQYSEQNY